MNKLVMQIDKTKKIDMLLENCLFCEIHKANNYTFIILCFIGLVVRIYIFFGVCYDFAIQVFLIIRVYVPFRHFKSIDRLDNYIFYGSGFLKVHFLFFCISLVEIGFTVFL